MDIKDFIIQVIHILVFGVFLLYLGIAVPTADWIYYIALALGIFLPIYWLATLRRQYVFWIVWHCLVAIVLIWVGIQKQRSPYFIFSLLIILGSAAIGYHLVRMIQNICS